MEQFSLNCSSSTNCHTKVKCVKTICFWLSFYFVINNTHVTATCWCRKLLHHAGLVWMSCCFSLCGVFTSSYTENQVGFGSLNLPNPIILYPLSLIWRPLREASVKKNMTTLLLNEEASHKQLARCSDRAFVFKCESVLPFTLSCNIHRCD